MYHKRRVQPCTSEPESPQQHMIGERMNVDKVEPVRRPYRSSEFKVNTAKGKYGRTFGI